MQTIWCLATTKVMLSCYFLYPEHQESNALYIEQVIRIREPSSETMKETINVRRKRFSECLQMQMTVVLLTVEY